jgi:hypothetical protein
MLALDLLAEQRIVEAQRRGEFDDLPGAGRPLALDDDPLVPEELRGAYRILKNAGYVPPEAAMLRDIRELERLIDRTPAGEQRRHAVLKLDLLRARLDAGRGAASRRGPGMRAYRDRVLARLSPR